FSSVSTASSPETRRMGREKKKRHRFHRNPRGDLLYLVVRPQRRAGRAVEDVARPGRRRHPLLQPFQTEPAPPQPLTMPRQRARGRMPPETPAGRKHGTNPLLPGGAGNETGDRSARSSYTEKVS